MSSLPCVVGLRGKVLVVGGYRGGFCEKLLEASPMPDKASASSSKTDSPLARAKPISDGGSASVITDLRRGRRNCGETAVGVRSEML